MQVKDFIGTRIRLVMDTQKITDTITLITGKSRGRFPFSHAILIEDDTTALIDTGCGIELLKQLPCTIDIVINSHSHPDHTAGNWLFAGIPLAVPREEIDFNSNIVQLSRRYAGDQLAQPWRDFVSTTMQFNNAHPTQSFGDTDVFHFGSTSLEAVHTPGHTVGHYCFFERREGILFSFDIDFTTFGPWYGHSESDIGQFIASIEKVRSLDFDVVVSSHKGVITEDIEMKFEQFTQVFHERDMRIVEALDTERTFEEIVDMALIYNDFSFHPLLLRYWEGMMVQKHLERLLDAGMVVRTEKGFLASDVGRSKLCT